MKHNTILKISLTAMIGLLSGCGGSNASSSPIPVSSDVPISSVKPVSSSKATELEIISQPKSVVVQMPQGCSFNVEVNDESLVKSYCWQILDGYNDEEDDDDLPFGMLREDPIDIGKVEFGEVAIWTDVNDSITGQTKTYVKPSSGYSYNEKTYRCVITDINDNKIYSDMATLNYSNAKEQMSLLYIGNYALKIGDSLDLSDTPNGTGVITFVSRHEIKLENVNFVNPTNVASTYETGSVGLFLYDYNYDEEDFVLNLVGDNSFYNTYWDPSHNAGGIGLNFYVGGHGVNTNFIVKGSGNLCIAGGTHAIYCPGHLFLETDLILQSVGDHYGTGIYSHKLTMRNGSSIVGSVNGSVVQTKNYVDESGTIALNGSVYLEEGSDIDVVVRPQHVSVGGTYCKAFSASDTLSIYKSNVNIILSINPKDFDSKHALSGASVLGGSVSTIIEESNLNLLVSVAEGEKDIIFSLYGIMSGDTIISKSNVKITMNTDAVNGIVGFSTDRTKIQDSKVVSEVCGSRRVAALQTSNLIEIKNSILRCFSTCFDDGESYGFLCGSMNLDNLSQIEIDSNGGLAFAALLGSSETEIGYDPEYVPTKVDISKFTTIEPVDATISTGSAFTSSGKYNVFETFYSLSDTSKPVSKIFIEK